MFAVMRSGGKQYRVALGDVVLMEKLAGEVGSEVAFGDILLLRDGDGIQVGAPLVEGASVRAEVLAQERGPKVVSYKRRRRKASSSSTRGHRQELTRVRITAIGDAALPKLAPAAASQGESETRKGAVQADGTGARSPDESDSGLTASESGSEEAAAVPKSESAEKTEAEMADSADAGDESESERTESASADSDADGSGNRQEE